MDRSMAYEDLLRHRPQHEEAEQIDTEQKDPHDLPFAIEKLEKKAEIGAGAFFDVDMRVGRVTEVDDFPEARKPAWKLAVDFGPVVGTLRTSAQITNYSKEELAGRLVVGAINLGTKRIAGFTSEFLVLGSLDPDGLVRLLVPDPAAEPGAPIA